MIYFDFQDKKLSGLGFGTMRLPTNPDGSIDKDHFGRMVDLAMEKGVNYFDTAWPYHNNMSEFAVGEALKKYPRDSFYLATKYPGHQIVEKYDPKAVFEEQLRKCQVEYFDFYLLHNVYENSLDVYLDPQWGILDYFREQKRLGRIRHLGFSTHGSPELMEKFLDIAGEDMEFCQIQLNWVDWTLQDAKRKVELLNRRNIPIWVMEPVRGGKLCSLDEDYEAQLKALRPEETVPGWGFRFLQSIPGVTMVLSGMSNMEQMEANIETYQTCKPLNDREMEVLLGISRTMQKAVGCTACRYCTEYCPQGLDIPNLIAIYNDLQFQAVTNVAMRLDGVPAEKQPANCIGCGQCAKMCPQLIEIPQVMAALAKKLESVPKWAEICREREENAKKAMGK